MFIERGMEKSFDFVKCQRATLSCQTIEQLSAASKLTVLFKKNTGKTHACWKVCMIVIYRKWRSWDMVASNDSVQETWCPVCGQMFVPQKNHKDGKMTETCSPRCGAIRREVKKGRR